MLAIACYAYPTTNSFCSAFKSSTKAGGENLVVLKVSTVPPFAVAIVIEPVMVVGPTAPIAWTGLRSLSWGANILLLHFYGALVELAPSLLTMVEPPPKVDMDTIPSSTSTTQSANEGQVFGDFDDDHAEGPNPHAEKVPSSEPPRAQTFEGGPAPVLAIIEHMVASIKFSLGL